MVLGPMLGTFVYSTFGLETSIAVMGVVFLLSALVLIRLPEDNMKSQTAAVKGQFRKDFVEGFRYVWQSRVAHARTRVYSRRTRCWRSPSAQPVYRNGAAG